MGIAQFFTDRLHHYLGYPPTACQERFFETLAAFADAIEKLIKKYE